MGSASLRRLHVIGSHRLSSARNGCQLGRNWGPRAHSGQANRALAASPGTVKPMTAETLATRIRTLRLQQHIPQTTAATTAGVHVTTWRAWESGSKRPRLERGAAIAQALNVPVAALFADEVVLAEVRLSNETLETVRREGREGCRQAAERLASRLEPLIWQEATRPPVDVSAGARPKRRRSRAEVLAGIAEANKMRAARERGVRSSRIE